MTREISRPIYLITDGGRLRSEGRLLESVDQALIAGQGRVGYVQLREELPEEISGYPPAGIQDLIKLGSELISICRGYNSKVIVSRNVELALEIGAAGVHLGASGVSIDESKKAGRNKFLLGYSAHGVEEGLTALRSGASYIFLSPIFSSSRTSLLRKPLGVRVLEEFKNAGSVYALGGISPKNIGDVRRAGATGFAVIGSVLESPDPGLAVRQLLQGWDDAHEAFVELDSALR